jgi:hypothetical protein
LTDKEKALTIGIQEYCEKPVNKVDMLQKIRTVLDQEEYPA